MPGYLLLHAEITVIELKVFIGVSVHLYLKYYQPNPGAALDSSHQAQNHHHLICPAVSAQVLWVSKYENYMRVHDIDSRLIPCNVETPAAGQLTEAELQAGDVEQTNADATRTSCRGLLPHVSNSNL